jgi:hypothetical protein
MFIWKTGIIQMGTHEKQTCSPKVISSASLIKISQSVVTRYFFISNAAAGPILKRVKLFIGTGLR